MSDMTRIRDEDDENRCTYNIPGHGQCRMKAAEGVERCKKHGGGAQLYHKKKQELKAYEKTKWAASIRESATDPAIKDLACEVGILRMLAANLLKRCKDEHDLMMMSGNIGDLMTKIQKMIESLHRLEKESSGLLSQSKLEQFAFDLLDILTEEIEDRHILDRIGVKVAKALHKITQDEDEL